eukprot:GFUD01015017.1.p1 GENE.GFUD01015017.1~~GFUD01015017.1.p1  ORF type:complete len:561 (+),score=121.00 GFUD01015017.1:687-2369(+)
MTAITPFQQAGPRNLMQEVANTSTATTTHRKPPGRFQPRNTNSLGRLQLRTKRTRGQSQTLSPWLTVRTPYHPVGARNMILELENSSTCTTPQGKPPGSSQQRRRAKSHTQLNLKLLIQSLCRFLAVRGHSFWMAMMGTIPPCKCSRTWRLLSLVSLVRLVTHLGHDQHCRWRQGGSDKSRYLKSVFPTAEEFLILDVLANSGNNVQKAADRLVKMGYVKKDPLAAPSTITENEKIKLRKKMKDKYENEFGIHETILFMALESSNYNEEQATNFVKSMIENMQQDKEVEKIRERDEKIKSKKIAEAEKIKLQKNAEAEKIKLQKIAEAEKIKSQKSAEAEKIKLQKIAEAEKLKSQKIAAAEKIKSQKIAEAKHPKQTSPKNVPRPSSPRISKGTNTQEKRSGGTECKTNAKGPNPDLRKGPNDALLLTDYVNWNGPNPELKRGPNPTGAQGPNLEFRQGPSGCSTGPNALNRKGPSSSIAKGPNPDSRKGPNDDLLLTEYDSWNGPNPELRQGPNLELHKGPGGCSYGPNIANRKGPQELRKGSIYSSLKEDRAALRAI